MIENPFAVFTPEGLSAQKVISIFSTDMPGLGNIVAPDHAFVVGTRGSGKSILLRYLEPDCQKLITNKQITELPYVSFYISFRETQAQISELARFDDAHGQVFFNEHLLVLAISAQIIIRFLKNNQIQNKIISYDCVNSYNYLMTLLGGEADVESISTIDALKNISLKLQLNYREAIQYIKQHAFRSEPAPYMGNLFGFDDLLLIVIDFLRDSLELSSDSQIFLLLDDADSLTDTQTKIVNSWLARRLSKRCSLKIAAQATAYKTMLTIFNSRIEAPHDYQEIDLSDLSTKASEKAYRSRIASIVQRRLESIDIMRSAEEFFPEDEAQKEAIEKEAQRLTAAWEAGEGRGFRARDDVQRYARPNYIADLGGDRKSRSTYSYSGFDQLVHISSGVTRFFLEAAADMYAQMIARSNNSNSKVLMIDPSIQNTVVREHATRQMIVALKDLENDIERLDGTPKRAVQLRNLINALGTQFEFALVDRAASERKFFSFALSDQPTPEIEKVLRLGVRYGYLFQSVIGRKEGVGRAPLYILSRRLAPLFNLDPMGFSAYKFMESERIAFLMDHPDEARLEIRRGRKRGQTGDGQITMSFTAGENDD